MSGYTKLFSSIIHSTVWRESDHIRIVWVTMLAMSDKDGIVEASVPGLADAARVSLSDCVDALERLKSPDEYSRSPEFEGRRIEEIEGGWEIINYAKYREMASIEERRRKAAIRQARFRERKKKNNDTSRTVTHSNAPSRTVMKSNDNAEAEAEADEKAKNGRPLSGTCAKKVQDFDAFWSAYPKKRNKQNALKAWNKMKPDLQRCLSAIERQKKSVDWIKDDGQFIPLPSSWINAGAWDNEETEKLRPVLNANEIPF